MGWPWSSTGLDAHGRYRRGDRYVVHLDLPGVDPDSIELTVEKNAVNVTARRSFPRAEGDQWLVSERPQGNCSRQLLLSENLNTDGIEASYEHGVLTITVAVAEAARPRKVAIASGGAGAAQKSIEAEAGPVTSRATGRTNGLQKSWSMSKCHGKPA